MPVKLCTDCDLEKEHRERGDAGTLRAKCNDCLAAYGKRWREEKWQKRKVYDTWRGAIRRCHDPRTRRWNPGTEVPSYRDYGELGIKVCRRWRDEEKGFERFLSDMGLPPSKEHTLDRIDPRKNYSPSNCRWATREEQWQNRKNTVWVTAHHPETGEEATLALGGWARVYGLKPQTVRGRYRRGWDPCRAISEPTPAMLEASLATAEGAPF